MLRMCRLLTYAGTRVGGPHHNEHEISHVRLA
jgi:hypothetical protein